MRRSLSGAEEASPRWFDKGDHFAAWEEPSLFTDELRAAFRSLQSTT